MVKNLKKKPRVYLAGKITNNRWRNCLYDDCEILGRNPGESVDYDIFVDEFIRSEHEEEDFIVTGPHSISCDHSCFHQYKRKHAAEGDSKGYICVSNSDIDRSDILYACRNQIIRSDIVFAYIESTTCYGTLAEIGYARSFYGRRNKHIAILFKNKTLADKMWFVAEMADNVFIQGSGEKRDEIRLAFNKTLEEYSYKN